MQHTLPAPDVVRCSFDEGFQPHLPVMILRWDPAAMRLVERLWDLPEGVCIAGPAPERFGVIFQRKGADAYAVRLVWNQTRLSWPSLTRAELLTTALVPLLRALGSELWYLLDQPVQAETVRFPRAA